MKDILPFFKSNPGKYDPVLNPEEDSSSEYEESKALSEAHTPPRATKLTPSLLYVSTVVFAALAVFFFLQNIQLRRRASFEAGYANELGATTLCSNFLFCFIRKQ
jgi:hypothetical protein